MKNPLRFRQIHLDFHTSEAIAGIGSRFNKRKFQEVLKRAEVNSVTTFALCHHGWSYYDTKVGQRHPGLSFDLLRAQFDACKEIGINVPIYMTAGVHNHAADTNPGWRQVDKDGRLLGWTSSNVTPGFKMLSFHSPYLDYLCEQVAEVMHAFPDADGIFYDIISQGEDCSVWALQHMKAKGLDPLKEEDRVQSRMDAMMKYYERCTAAVRDIDPNMPVFHNSGHVTPGYREILPYFSHLELESLPTGGWGYDHFPFLAKYSHKLGMEFLGMTGKFHSTWGEFGGYKHPNALRYECSAMLAYGAKCSVGDQLHPTGEIDETTYSIIGEAYREVAAKEAYVEGARNVADIALLSSQSVRGEELFRKDIRDLASDTGASRILLEAHLLFDIIDAEMDFADYKMLVLPDDVALEAPLIAKLQEYIQGGGKLFLTGESGIDSANKALFDCGGEVGELSPYQPDYALPVEALRPDFVNHPMVMYARSRRLKVTDGEALGEVFDPYFNREWDHFSSHQHAPNQPDPSGYISGVRKENVLYLAHPVFSIYCGFGSVALRQSLTKQLDYHLGEDARSVQLENFPSTGRVTLTHQPDEKRYVLHLLNGSTINRGGAANLHGGNMAGRMAAYEVIEEVRPLHDVTAWVRLPVSATKATLEPEGREIPMTPKADKIGVCLDAIELHQMVVFHY